jgi:hypothetical protein
MSYQNGEVCPTCGHYPNFKDHLDDVIMKNVPEASNGFVTNVPWYTGLKVGVETYAFVFQWVYQDKASGRQFMASCPGGVYEFQTGEQFDISTREGQEYLSGQDRDDPEIEEKAVRVARATLGELNYLLAEEGLL